MFTCHEPKPEDTDPHRKLHYNATTMCSKLSNVLMMYFFDKENFIEHYRHVLVTFYYILLPAWLCGQEHYSLIHQENHYLI